MKERIEDLGKLAAMLGAMVDHDLFDDTKRPRRPKHVDELFENKSQEEVHEIISELFWNIEEVEALLYQCLCIAEGNNDRDDQEYEPLLKSSCW